MFHSIFHPRVWSPMISNYWSQGNIPHWVYSHFTVAARYFQDSWPKNCVLPKILNLEPNSYFCGTIEPHLARSSKSQAKLSLDIFLIKIVWVLSEVANSCGDGAANSTVKLILHELSSHTFEVSTMTILLLATCTVIQLCKFRAVRDIQATTFFFS